MPNRRFTTLTLAATLLCGSAFAQYVWIDEKGVKQYSDQPPPASVPAAKIIRSGGKLPAATAPSEGGGDSANKLQKPVTTASKNEEFNKRRAEQAEKEKAASEEAQKNSEKAKNCERAHAYQRALETGVRIAHTDKSGERNYLTDEQRDKELAEVKRMLSGCK